MASGRESVDVEAARREIASGYGQAVDVRSEEEWSTGHVPGAIHFLEEGVPPIEPIGWRTARDFS